jgi:hypothetical protein
VIASTTSSAAADAGNTGNGTITMDVTTPVLAGAKNGVYRAVNDLVAANSGEFVVYDPDGIEIGRVAVGADLQQPDQVRHRRRRDRLRHRRCVLDHGRHRADRLPGRHRFAPAGTDGSQRPPASSGTTSPPTGRTLVRASDRPRRRGARRRPGLARRHHRGAEGGGHPPAGKAAHHRSLGAPSRADRARRAPFGARKARTEFLPSFPRFIP